jgi:uncharacterized protein involved in type VI secretion and phage assembly
MGLLDLFNDTEPAATDSRRLGLVRAEVTDNLDLTMQGRVKLTIPTLPGIEPWATVCAPFAGDGYGLWCMPQVGDTVIVAFEHGDPDWPVVIGSVWDVRKRPPVDQPMDAVNKRVVKTPKGHEILLDDLEQEVTITHVAGHKLTMAAKEVKIELAGGVGSISLELPGKASLSGDVSAEVSGRKASVKGDLTLDLSAATTTVKADATCRVSGSLVTIN